MRKKACEYAYPNIIIAMAINGDTFQSLANAIGITRQCLFKKMNGETDWTISEIETVCKRFHKNYYELFKRGE